MASTDSDSCRPLVPAYTDHLFRQNVDHFSDHIGIGGRHRSGSVDDIPGTSGRLGRNTHPWPQPAEQQLGHTWG